MNINDTERRYEALTRACYDVVPTAEHLALFKEAIRRKGGDVSEFTNADLAGMLRNVLVLVTLVQDLAKNRE